MHLHAKVDVDDVWATMGSDNLNHRSWTHDRELPIGVLGADLDPKSPSDPAGLGDGARVFAQDLRLRLWREHLDRDPIDVADLLEPLEAFEAFRRRQAGQLAARHDGGGPGERPPGRVLVHEPGSIGPFQCVWAEPVCRTIFDLDDRPWRDRLRGRPDRGGP
ncbi:hypothetical protein [Pengzhenrongella phosphoraccumulans]|uniref:hypothetical protein n=1 Tax=Pengzhenrongella phosphoraccumulans TaxID=3114394 RepID=UPI00388CF468